MARLYPSLLLLVANMVLVSRDIRTWGWKKVVREFKDIPESYVYVQQALWFAMKEYNKASKDKYTFKVVKVLKSQEQVTDSLDYFLEVKIGRTMCKKALGDNENCLLQQDPEMQKVDDVLCDMEGIRTYGYLDFWGNSVLAHSPEVLRLIKTCDLGHPKDQLLMRSSQVRVTHSWRISDEGKGIESYFLATVEYALHIFNVKSKDTNAYRLVSILDSQREKIETLMAFSMELKLRRTRCGKFDEDIDNCPFEENPELNNTFICFFTISIDPWRTMFQLLNKTCLEGTY